MKFKYLFIVVKSFLKVRANHDISLEMTDDEIILIAKELNAEKYIPIPKACVDMIGKAVYIGDSKLEATVKSIPTKDTFMVDRDGDVYEASIEDCFIKE